jgi:serine/threonine protein kinase
MVSRSRGTLALSCVGGTGSSRRGGNRGRFGRWYWRRRGDLRPDGGRLRHFEDVSAVRAINVLPGVLGLELQCFAATSTGKANHGNRPSKMPKVDTTASIPGNEITINSLHNRRLTESFAVARQVWYNPSPARIEGRGDFTICRFNVTPKNILLETPTKTAKLGDLIKAKAMEGVLAKQITKPGELVGDVTYMSPGADARHDGSRPPLRSVWPGGRHLRLLTGRPPLTGATLVEKISKIRTELPVKPTKYQMSIPSGFEGIVLKLLAKRPEARYQSATDLLKELERVGKLNGVTV